MSMAYEPGVQTDSSPYQSFRESNGASQMDDKDKTISRVAQFIEQLHTDKSSPTEKELITARLLGMAKARKEVLALIGSHGQTMPLFISILRTGTLLAQLNVAATLTVLCRDKDLRMKVLLGGCIPPLLSMLTSRPIEARRAAAEAIYAVSPGGLSHDHVGMKIFITEGVVPTLWDQLNPESKQDSVVQGFVTRTLRNLCGDKDGYWTATLEAGGVEIIVGLLSSDNVTTQSNVASLLARVILSFEDSIPKIVESKTIITLIRLVGPKNDISVRANAADALKALCFKSAEARRSIADAQGIPILITAVNAPSKDGKVGEVGQELQRHATEALSHICGGMSRLILHLGELSRSPRLAAPVTDILGALAYSLMVFEQTEESGMLDAVKIETILIALLKPRDTKLFQERVLEAMASLYGNEYSSRTIKESETKRILVGLATLASGDAQEQLILSLIRLCSDDGVNVWEASGRREGIQLLISFLGLVSEQHREYAVELLAVLTNCIDDSKWAITAAGGIPPLVQLLETGSQKAREVAAHVLWDLCCHSDDIRACVESAGAIPALLSLLRDGGVEGQKASAKTLIKLIHSADAPVINHLLVFLLGDSPRLKTHVIDVFGHVLSFASQIELTQNDTAANKGLRSLVQVLDSSNEKTQEHAASVLANLFNTHHGIYDCLAADEALNPCLKFLTQGGGTQTARAYSVLPHPKQTRDLKHKCNIDVDVKPLIKLAKTSSITSAETAVAALVNLLSDPQVAAEALEDDAVSALMRVLAEGSVDGKKNVSRALGQILRHYPVGDVLVSSAQCRFAVLAILDSINAMEMDGNDVVDALDVIAALARSKNDASFTCTFWSTLAEVPSSLGGLMSCLSEGSPKVQDKAIKILSRLCGDQPALLGDALISRPRSIGTLANRVMNSSTLEVRVGGAAMLICAAKEHQVQAMTLLNESGYLKPLIYSLVDMMKQDSRCSSLEIEVMSPRGYGDRHVSPFAIPDPASVLGGTVALWLLSLVSSFHIKHKLTVLEAGGLDVLLERLANHTFNQSLEFEDTEGIWITSMLVAILFQDASVVLSSVSVECINPLAVLLKSDEVIDRYFAAQAMACLVSHGNKQINLGVAESSAVVGLVSLIGYVESDMPNLIALCEEFCLVPNPEEFVLNCLFEIEEVRIGSTACKTIPLLVGLLRPMPDRPRAPIVAVHLLTRIADGSDENKLAIAEAGALDALSRYMSLSPQELNEATISELLRILFTNAQLLRYEEAAISCANQLIAILHLGSRDARFSAVRALDELFDAKSITDSEASTQAVHPLLDMLGTSASESEQHAALSVLIKLTSENTSKVAFIADAEGNPLKNLHTILCSSSSSHELKGKAALLCFVLFSDSRFRSLPFAAEFVEPLVSLMIQSGPDSTLENSIRAFEKLLDGEVLVNLASAYDVVDLLVSQVSRTNYRLIEACIRVLIKLGKDRTPRKLDMVKAGIIENCLALLPAAPSSLCSAIAELFRILTNSSAISKSASATKIVEPLLMLLLRSDFCLQGQHSALQALVNILEKPRNLASLKLTPSQIIGPLITFLESPSQPIKQLGSELLTHLLEQEYFKDDITTKSAVSPLVQLAGTGVLNLQETAIKALESISLTWPKEVADAGGIFEISKVIVQDDPDPPDALLESAALVLSTILRSNADFYFKVPIEVLVKMLHSIQDSVVTVALNALVALERIDAASCELMVEAGAIDALLDLLRSHQFEEESVRLLEALVNNVRVREMKVSKYAIAPLAQYLLDPQTQSPSSKLLATLALGNLSQHEGLARATDSASACRTLVSLLKDQPAEELTMVAICALQNFVMRSRTNRRAVAEAGGVSVVRELLLSSNPDIGAQAALLIRYLFSNHTLQEYMSNELIRSLTAALEKEKEVWSTANGNEEILRTIHIIFTNFPKFLVSEAATQCIPQLVPAIKSDNEDVMDSALNVLCLFKHFWLSMPVDVSRSQSMLAAETIPVLQKFMKTCPPGIHERAESLLHSLPGCLTVTIIRANNLKQTTGGLNAFCQLAIGNGPARQTKVVSHSASPEWKEGFTWAFDVPPKGQKLRIVCKSKTTFGKTTLGRVAIELEKVVSEGTLSGEFNLSHESIKDGSSRTLEVEITWSNKKAEETQQQQQQCQ